MFKAQEWILQMMKFQSSFESFIMRILDAASSYFQRQSLFHELYKQLNENVFLERFFFTHNIEEFSVKVFLEFFFNFPKILSLLLTRGPIWPLWKSNCVLHFCLVHELNHIAALFSVSSIKLMRVSDWEECLFLR